MTTKKKTFDCVEMMHQGALRIRDALKGKSREEQLAYWKRQNEQARVEHKRLRQAPSARGPAE